jgi:hypothetical protein
MRVVLSIPMLALVIAAYLLAGLGGGLMVDADVFYFTMPSSAVLALRVGDFFMLAGLVALFIEMIKSARSSVSTVVDHMLSTLTLVAAIVAFLLLGYCGTAPFFLLTVMALIDVIAGFSVSIFSARRDYSINNG